MGFLPKFLSNKGRAPLATCFDTQGKEAAQIVSRHSSPGLRAEITQSILPFLQITFSRADSAVQYFATLYNNTSHLQISLDPSSGAQLRASAIFGPAVTRIHTIVKRTKEIFTQVESALSSPFANICVKLIKPTLHAANLIYILNFWRGFGVLHLGAEIVGRNNEIGASVAARVENRLGVCTVSMQHVKMVCLSLYKRVSRVFEVGAELRSGPAGMAGACGIRARNHRSDVRLNVDSGMNIGFFWEERLSETLAVDFNAVLDIDGLEYGIGFTYDS